MLSTPRALPTLSRLMANSVSHTVKSQDNLESHPWTLRSPWTLAQISLAKYLSLLRNRLLPSSCEVMELAVIGHYVRVVDLPISLLMVYQAQWLKCVKSMDSTVSVHLSLRLSLNLEKRLFITLPFALLVSASLLMCSRSSYSPSQHGI